MSTQQRSRLAGVRGRIKRIGSELDYANRRMFAIRTGDYWMKGRVEKKSRGRAPRRAAVPAH